METHKTGLNSEQGKFGEGFSNKTKGMNFEEGKPEEKMNESTKLFLEGDNIIRDLPEVLEKISALVLKARIEADSERNESYLLAIKEAQRLIEGEIKQRKTLMQKQRDKEAEREENHGRVIFNDNWSSKTEALDFKIRKQISEVVECLIRLKKWKDLGVFLKETQKQYGKLNLRRSRRVYCDIFSDPLNDARRVLLKKILGKKLSSREIVWLSGNIIPLIAETEGCDENNSLSVFVSAPEKDQFSLLLILPKSEDEDEEAEAQSQRNFLKGEDSRFRDNISTLKKFNVLFDEDRKGIKDLFRDKMAAGIKTEAARFSTYLDRKLRLDEETVLTFYRNVIEKFGLKKIREEGYYGREGIFEEMNLVGFEIVKMFVDRGEIQAAKKFSIELIPSKYKAAALFYLAAHLRKKSR